MPHELPKAYDPSAIETRWAEYWVKENLFSLATRDSPDRVFTLLLPPPNVTGRLHMGHMLNQTEMDIIIRWKRMSGFRTLWVPGTDHASIATQMMVERQLLSEGKKRQDLGREKFLERTWEWKRHYGGAILEQMKRLGVSVDWQREYFTMDENLSRAVREAFVRLHEDGLIYRGNYIVNWCPGCLTAISDLEVVHEEVAGKLHEIRYPVIGGGEGDFIVVATTRPETMLGDTAIAVNPKDQRYQGLIGKKVRLPLMGREIPVVADDWANPEFGTGAVKVTPAHDPNDFELGKRHNLPQINIMDETARMNGNAGAYAGLDRYEARKRVLADLEAQGLLAGTKDHTFQIGKCDRCKSVVEPRLSMQWFVKVEGKFANRAIEAVERGYINITPENYKTIYLNWMRGLYDWCISRQLWWGHRIPAWHCSDCDQVTVARETPTKCAHCGKQNIVQDQDVLDTWFSSGLLPFTVFGWPEKTKDLEAFYPTSLLITGFDILFLWVSRMIMLSCYFMAGEGKLESLPEPERQAKLKSSVPFKEVYIHALVRDAERQKMSKTKGNVLDPIDIIQRYGTDAVRFTLASMAAPGTDIAFSESRTESYRAFANKIWNAARFIFMNVDKAQESGAWSLKEFNAASDGKSEHLEDRWILSRFNAVVQEANAALAEYRFHEAAHVVYHFFWGEFCDWYIEIVKLRLNAGETKADKIRTGEALNFLMRLFENALRLLSPFMPFITEEIWQAIYDGKPPAKSIALSEYPEGQKRLEDQVSESDMALLQKLIVDIRYLRADVAIPNKESVEIQIHTMPPVKRIESELGNLFKRGDADRVGELFREQEGVIKKLAKVTSIAFIDSPIPERDGIARNLNFEVRLVYHKQLDPEIERERLHKDLQKMKVELGNAQRQLTNQQFLAKAPASVVDGIRRRAAELTVLMEKAQGALSQLR